MYSLDLLSFTKYNNIKIRLCSVRTQEGLKIFVSKKGNEVIEVCKLE